ncbi:glucosamine-6-phosphate deaminase [Marinobacter sp. X15-166B]|uniref:glucosamine-6-phosphate deaminase n=1 Tax=Marinobacter sp. X15-166B TaxID=1897620 RepID=UPI00085C674C|nr:glucosamine-6-phosphate deaminase [Marinobacter sp. X15-166B]OEY65166.1 glucosamine-6-phosphate deaminase [Marinobacter sp. X15-166B]
MYKIFDTTDEVSHYAAARLLGTIKAIPTAVLGLATGSTMVPVYAQLLRGLQQAAVDVSTVTTFNLDEYVGLSAGHAQSYHYYMYQHLFNELNIPAQNIHLPDGMASNLDEACQSYTDTIKIRGGLDFQLLGIGTNGHIGFNEPQTSFASRTHVVELTAQTRLDNSRFFADKHEMPTRAITLGILDILEAKEIVLVATGRNKADIMAELYHSEIDEALPASALKQHANLTIVLDREAASALPREAVEKKIASAPADFL